MITLYQQLQEQPHKLSVKCSFLTIGATALATFPHLKNQSALGMDIPMKEDPLTLWATDGGHIRDVEFRAIKQLGEKSSVC